MGGGCVPGDGTIACIGLIHSIGAGMRKEKKKKKVPSKKQYVNPTQG
jgi:hypothetical protein